MTITSAHAILQITFGNPTHGCRHCGTVITRTSENGKFVYHHPGVVCCADAIRDQIRYREDRFEQLKEMGRRSRQEVTDLEEKARRAIGKDQIELNYEADRARAAYQRHTIQMQTEIQGDPQLGIAGIKHEINELNELLNRMELK